MTPDVITVLRNNVVITQPVGNEILVAMAIAAAAAQTAEAGGHADRAEAALAEIEDIASGAPDAPSVLNKLDRTGGNVIDPPAFRLAVGAAAQSFTATGVSATVPALIEARFGDVPNAIRDFNAKADGVTDDTAALQAFVNACQAHKRCGILPGTGGNYRVTAPITLSGTGGDFQGAGNESAWIKADGNFSSVFTFAGTAAGKALRDIWIDTGGTTTRCANFVNGGQAVVMQRMRFSGDLVGDLVYSQASGYLDFDACKWDMNNAGTWGLALDMFNQGTRVRGRSIFGGVGKGAVIRKTGAFDRVEGTVFENTQFINTGSLGIDIGNSLLTQIIGCNLDQQATSAVKADDSADFIQIVGTWMGLAPSSTGICLDLSATIGNGHNIVANHFYGGSYGIVAAASAVNRVEGLGIIGNTFTEHADASLSLDSVLDCRVVGNRDQGFPSGGSWFTTGTFGPGSYTFANNRWHTTAPGLFHTGSTYRFYGDTGIVGDNRGTGQPGASASALNIPHGLFRTPTGVMLTGDATIGSVGFTNLGVSAFDALWSPAATPVICWSAWV